jgi:methionyl-tRNA formyltransferase
MKMRINNALFVGTRCDVFNAATQAGINFTRVLAPERSRLYVMLNGKHAGLESISSKPQVVEMIRQSHFDLLVSNGCPYILPVSSLKKQNQCFVNVHPSLLPAFKGRHPVNGAVLHDFPVGATCHEMDDGVDTGKVISQVRVEAKKGTDVRLLYRLAFLAEGDAFAIALDRGFLPSKTNEIPAAPAPDFFNRTTEVLTINFRDPIDLTVRRVQAFSVPGQMARFSHHGQQVTVTSASSVVSPYLERKFGSAPVGTVLMRFDDSAVIRVADGFLQIDAMPGQLDVLKEGHSVLEASPPQEFKSAYTYS